MHGQMADAARPSMGILKCVDLAVLPQSMTVPVKTYMAADTAAGLGSVDFLKRTIFRCYMIVL